VAKYLLFQQEKPQNVGSQTNRKGRANDDVRCWTESLATDTLAIERKASLPMHIANVSLVPVPDNHGRIMALSSHPFFCLQLACWAIGAFTMCDCQAKETTEPTYAVVVSTETAQDPAWAQVVATLIARHHGQEIRYTGTISNSLAALKATQPRYVAFVARPEETGLEFVRQIHLLSRRMDDDPYVDFLWGIITAATAKDAQRLAADCPPLVVKNALTTTGINNALVDNILTISDGKSGEWFRKDVGGEKKGNVSTLLGPQLIKTTMALFNQYWETQPVDLLVTSSHATTVNLEMPFSLGSLAVAGGRLYPLEKQAFAQYLQQCQANSEDWFYRPTCRELRNKSVSITKAIPFAESANPKVLVAAGNCLLGDTMGSDDSLAMAWLTHYGVHQLVGYTVTTWVGRMGWGTNSRWQESGGQISLAEAFVLTNQYIINDLVAKCPALATLEPDADTIEQLLEMAQNGKVRKPTAGMTAIVTALGALRDDQKLRNDLLGLIHDRDTVAFYGDPAWSARFDRSKHGETVTWSWSQDDQRRDVLTLISDKGWKPTEGLALFLPRHMTNATVSASDGLSVTLADDFLMISKLILEAGKTYRMVIAPTTTP
jgi:zinc protease